jgi:hypothetical protein
VGYFVNVGNEEKELIEVVINGNAGMVLCTPACKVTNLCLTALGDLQFKWTLLPKGKTIVQGRSWNMRLQYGENPV